MTNTDRSPTLEMTPYEIAEAAREAWADETTAVTPVEDLAQARVASRKPLIRIAILPDAGGHRVTAVIPGVALSLAHRVCAVVCDFEWSGVRAPEIVLERFCTVVSLWCHASEDSVGVSTVATLLADIVTTLARDYRVEVRP